MKRWPLRILLCLILGAITTVAVAWGFAFYGDLRGCEPVRSQVVRSRTEPWASVTLLRISGVGLDWTVCDVVYPEPSMCFLMRDYVYLGGHISKAAERAKHMENVELGEIDFGGADQLQAWFEKERETDIRAELRSGWPWPCFSAFLEPKFDNRPGIDWNPLEKSQVIEAGRHNSERISEVPYERYLPRRLILDGFLIDTLFYAAIWFGVFFAPGMGKRAIRRKRGRCPRCGYDLRGGVISDKRLAISVAGCPECGWNRKDDGVDPPI